MSNLRYPGQQFLQKAEWTSLLVLFGFVLAGLFVAQFFSYVVVGAFYAFDFDKVTQLSLDPRSVENGRVGMLLLQGVTSACLFVLIPVLYVQFYEDKPAAAMFAKRDARLRWGLLITVLVMVAYMPMSAYSVQWNESVTFPEGLELFERLLRKLEDTLAELTKFLIDFDGTGEFLLGLLVIAVLPGVGEELLFRGVLQNKLHQLSKNAHLAIWVSAFIFSAFHLQFYGLLPRMLLGALFGYLYIWSGTLLVPMFAHFLNNGYTLTAVYLHKLGVIETDIENAEVSWQAALFSVVLSLLMLFLFRRVQQRGKG